MILNSIPVLEEKIKDLKNKRKINLQVHPQTLTKLIKDTEKFLLPHKKILKISSLNKEFHKKKLKIIKMTRKVDQPKIKVFKNFTKNLQKTKKLTPESC